MKKKRNKNKKVEWSKLVCGLIVLYGIANGIVYNIAVFMDKCPDSALAVQSVTTIVGGYMSYLMYQFGLKNSRNKFGIDSDGNPYRQDMSNLYGEDKDVNDDSVG
jgi:uncharacterized membrane-anchored protein